MLLQLLKALVPKPDTVLIWASAFTPILALGLALWTDRRRRRKTEKPPQDEKLLRPAGYTLGLKLDDAVYDILLPLFVACALCPATVVFGFTTAAMLAAMIPWYWVLIPALSVLISFGGAVWLVQRSLALFAAAMDYRLGLRGEQAVAEILHEVADCGYRAFHDFPGGDDWNIDHIVVGHQGVFAIETKARMKRWSCKDQRAHEVRFDAKKLVFPWRHQTKFVDRETLPQAERNARSLATYLFKKTGELVAVEPLVVIPGWWVEKLGGASEREMVMNAKYLAGFLRRQPKKLPTAQVIRIMTAVEEKCRDVEF